MTTNIRFRVDFSDYCSVGPGKVSLLEAIGKCGSLSQAARNLNMSYRRAWLLVADLNGIFRKPVTSARAGGTRGGGMRLTQFGKTVIKTYRELEQDITRRAEVRMGAISRDVVIERRPPSLSRPLLGPKP